MIDLLYLTHNRLEFTKASLRALFQNTDWRFVNRLLIYDDASEDGTREHLSSLIYPVHAELHFGAWGGPVAVMNHYLSAMSPHKTSIFGKIDSDTMVPRGWLAQSIEVMESCPVDLLGIEAFHRVVTEPTERTYLPSSHIGGIGLMRAGAFVTLPRPDGRFGFTAWQEHSEAKRGFISPSLPVFLLDRLPREPWLSLSREYVARGWQRPWGPYEERDRDLWSWWCE